MTAFAISMYRFVLRWAATVKQERDKVAERDGKLLEAENFICAAEDWLRQDGPPEVRNILLEEAKRLLSLLRGDPASHEATQGKEEEGDARAQECDPDGE